MTDLTLTQGLARKARPAGLLCLVIIVTGPGAELGLPGPLIDFGDADATAAAILAAPGRYRLARADGPVDAPALALVFLDLHALGYHLGLVFLGANSLIMDLLGAARRSRTSLRMDREPAPYAEPNRHHSARAAARFFLKLALE